MMDVNDFRWAILFYMYICNSIYFLTHCILNELFCHTYKERPFSIKGVLGYVNLDIFVGKWLNNLQNSEDPDQMPHYVASDLGLHFCRYPLGVFQNKMG